MDTFNRLFESRFSGFSQTEEKNAFHFRSLVSKASPQELTNLLEWNTKKRSLYSYQANSVKQMLMNAIQNPELRHGTILGDEMGLGKTLQSLSVAVGLQKAYKNQPPALFVIPKSTLSSRQWVEEALRNNLWTEDEIFVLVLRCF